jgi:hypothetical protein
MVQAGASYFGNDSSSSGFSGLVPNKDDSSRYWGRAVTNGESSGYFPMLGSGIYTDITRVKVCLTGVGDW